MEGLRRLVGARYGNITATAPGVRLTKANEYQGLDALPSLIV